MKKKENQGCIQEEKSVIGISAIKLLIRIVFTAILIFQADYTEAQTPKVTIKKENAGIEEILKEIQKQTGYNYLLNHEEIPEGIVITIRMKNVTIDEAMKRCLRKLPLDYEILDKVIIIKPAQTGSNPGNMSNTTLKQTIRGVIIDKESGMPLTGTNIIVLNSTPLIGGISDDEGNFCLENVPVGRHTLRITYIGYEDLVIPEILVGSAKEVILILQLTEAIIEFDEVEVRPYSKGTPKNEMATVSARSFSVEESKRYAASISDPGRMALSFAGVQCDDDFTNQIVIRGNSPTGMLWQVEGVQIPNPNHFMVQGYSPGAVSILSTNMIGQSDFFTGAFPAEYGNATSGVFDISLRNGNNKKSEKTFQFGFLGADIALEGPFSKNYNGSYLINYRYSTLSILNLIGIRIDDNELPKYTDLSYKLNLPTNKAGTFSVWGLGGKSHNEYIPAIDTSLYPDAYSYTGFKTPTSMGAAGISNIYFINNTSFVKSSISYSGDSYSDITYYIDTNFHKVETWIDKLSSSALRYSLLFNKKVGTRLTIKSGIIFSQLYYFLESKEYFEDSDSWLYHKDDNGSSETYQAFLQSKFKFSNRISISLGAHYLLFGINKKNSLDPRAGLTWNLSNKNTIGVGFGLHSKHEQLPVYFLKDSINGKWDYVNKDLDLIKAYHYVLSYSKMIKNDLNVKAEIYYQKLLNIPVIDDSTKANSTINDNMEEYNAVSEGIGRNYGLEITLEKYFTNNYYYLATASIFDSKYRALDGNWYNTRYNTRYIVNFTGGKEWNVKDNNLVGVNIKIIYGGGKRYTPYDVEKMVSSSEDDNEVYLQENKRWGNQHKPYFRIDLGCSYRINKVNSSHVISLDIQNSTFVRNIGGTYWDSDENKSTGVCT